MFSVPTRSLRQVDELLFFARRISIDGTLWIEEISSNFSSFFSLSLSSSNPPNERNDFFSFYTLDTWLTSRHVSPLLRSIFAPKKFISFLIKFILNELSSTNFLTSEIFVKISSLKSLMTHHPENSKKNSTVLEFDENFMGHQISRDESNGAVCFVI